MLKLFFCEIIFLLFSQLYYYPEIVLRFLTPCHFLGIEVKLMQEQIS